MFAIIDAEAERLHRRRIIRNQSKIDLFCQFCQRRFNKSYNLMIHERTHIDVFVCEVCGKQFKKSDGLRQHRSQHSPNSSPTNSFY